MIKNLNVDGIPFVRMIEIEPDNSLKPSDTYMRL